MVPKRILIIEDNEHYREILVRALAELGFTVETTSNGREGLEVYFAGSAPDLLVIELMIPEIDGLEVCDIIRKTPQGRQVPIIIISRFSKSEKYHQRITKEMNLSGVFSKPISMDGLLLKVSQILGETENNDGLKAQEAFQSVSGKTSEKDLRGELSREQTVSSILFSFYEDKKSGTIIFKQNDRTISVYLSNGIPVYADSSLPEDDLFRFLEKRGKLTTSQKKEALLYVNEHNIGEEEALIALNFLSVEEIHHLQKELVKITIARCIQWYSGNYTVVKQEEKLIKIPIFDFHPLSLLKDSSRAITSPYEVEKKLQSFPAKHFLISKENIKIWEKIEMSDLEKKFIEQINNSIPIDRVIILIDKNPELAHLINLFFDLNQIQVVAQKKKIDYYDLMIQEALEEIESRTLEQKEEKFNKASEESLSKAEVVEQDISVEVLEEKSNSEVKKIEIESNIPTEENFLSTYERLMSLDYYELFGLKKESFDSGVLTKAYFSLARQYHPDLIVNKSDEKFRSEADDLFHRIKEAYSVLKDEFSRSNYDTGETSLTGKREIVQAEESQGQEIENNSDENLIDNASDKFEEELELETHDFSMSANSIITESQIKESSSTNAEEFEIELDYDDEPLTLELDDDSSFNDFEKNENENEVSLPINNSSVLDTLNFENQELELNLDTSGQAKKYFQQGKTYEIRNNFNKAIEYFTLACNNDEENANYRAWLGWATFQKGHKLKNNSFIDDAISILMKALSLDKNCERAHFFLGKIFLSKNNEVKAENQFNKALKLDKNATDTIYELKKLKKK